MKNELLHQASSTAKKEAQHLVGLSGFCRQHIGGCSYGPFTKGPNKLLVLIGAQSREYFATGPGSCEIFSITWSICFCRPNGTQSVHGRQGCYLKPFAKPLKAIIAQALRILEQDPFTLCG